MEIIAVLSIIVVVLLIGVIALFLRNRTLDQIIRDLKHAPPDWAHQQAQTTISTATQKANTIVANAEIESLKLATQEQMGSQLFEEQYHQKLEQLMAQLSAVLNQSLSSVQQRYEQHLQTSEARLEQSQVKIEEGMRTKVNELLFNFEENLSSFLSNSEQKSFEAINLELKAAKQLIESYKTQQLGLVDENIVAILERTLQLVLKQKLSLTNQLDLVYESLEQARSEKFFG